MCRERTRLPSSRRFSNKRPLQDRLKSPPETPAPSAQAAEPAPTAAGGGYAREVLVRNPQGLHARPAAEFVKLANTFPVKVTVNGKDAKSLLGVMSLGLVAGSTASIASEDDGGAQAVDALADLVETGFGEI